MSRLVENATIPDTEFRFSNEDGISLFRGAVDVFLCPCCDNVHVVLTDTIRSKPGQIFQTMLELDARQAEALAKALLDPQCERDPGSILRI